ncbi:MAG: chlorohydrolase, partial [Acidobacteriota bacterium]
MNLLIHNAIIFTNDDERRVFTDQAVAIEDATIREVGPTEEMERRFAAYERLDGGGRLLMPGLTNAHMHFYSTYARGLTLPAKPHNFPQILKRLWWRLDRSL